MFIFRNQSGVARSRGEYQGDGSGWVLQSATAYVFDGMRVIEERDGNNWPQVGYTRGLDLSGTLEGAGGIGGLLARSYDYSNCDNTITYYLTNNSGYCITNLAIWDDYNTYVSGATVADGDTAVFSFPGVPGANYYVFGDSCDYYFIQVYSDSFTGTLDTHLVNFTVDGDPQASETGYALCDSGSSEWLTHNYYHADGGGNITALESSVETLTASYRYDPFGNVLSQSGGLADANTYRFSSKEFMPTSGLYYYGYRFYAPGLQRWLSSDPINELGSTLLITAGKPSPALNLDGDEVGIRSNAEPGESRELNPYGFVENKPTTEVDPFGLFLGFGYGNWCGWSRSGPGDPIDEVDAACQRHDNCLATWADACKFKFCNVVEGVNP